MYCLKLSIFVAAAGALWGTNSLTFAENLPEIATRWTEEHPFYSQHSWEKNLLRYHAGGRVFGDDDHVWGMTGVLRDAASHGRALITDDPTIPIVIGTSGRVIDYALGQRFLLKRVTFLNEGIAGELEVLVAATNPAEGNGRWVSISKLPIKPAEREHVLKFAAVDCRYVRLRFVTNESGKVFGLGAFGIRKAVEFYDPDERGVLEDLESSAAASVGDDDDPVDLDEYAPPVSVESLDASATNSLGWSRVEMVSSIASADPSTTALMLDEDAATQYRFAKADAAPTVVVDLGRTCDCGRVSVVYKRGEPGEMKMWLADSRPNGQLKFGDQKFRVRLERKIEDSEGRGRASFNEFRRAGRYLVLQWKSKDAHVPKNFGISEIAVFEHREKAETLAGGERLRKLVVEPKQVGNGSSLIQGSRLKSDGTGGRSSLPRKEGTPVKIREEPVSR